MRGSRLLAAVAVVLAVGVPALSMGSPPPAYAGHSEGVHSTAQFPSVDTPLVQTVFNHPSVQSTGGTNDSYDINDNEFLLVNPAWRFPGSLIQVSLYKMSDNNLAGALDYAAYTGSTVQVLLDGKAETEGCGGVAGCVNPTFQTLEYLNTINQQPGRSGTWLKTCSGYGPGNPTPLPGAGDGCLGQSLNHNKFILMSKTLWQLKSVVNDVVFQTSSNDTKRQYTHAFNNAVIVANRPALYDDYMRYFAREAAAYRSTTPSSGQVFTRRSGTTVDSETLRDHDIETLSFPRAATDDPLLTALRSVSTARRCANPSAGPNDPKHTNIYLGMFAINGPSTTLQKLAKLANAGCRIHIVYSGISRAAYRALHIRHVSLQQLCTPVTKNQRHYYVHSKYLLIAGTSHALGRNRRIVYTGSDNLTTNSLTASDNRDLRYVEPATAAPVYRSFQANFRQMSRLAAANPQGALTCKASTND